MDLTADTAALADATAEATRLLAPRYTEPVLAGLLLHATADGLTLAGNDRERAVSLSCAAIAHTEGTVLVPAKPLAETLRALEDPAVRLVVEGSQLAVRVPGARFALPLLDRDLHPGAGAPATDPVAEVDAIALATALRTVAGTAAKDDSLPMFTGVRMHGDGTLLRLVGSDRYRMATASLPMRGTAPFDVLVPAGLLGELAKLAGGTVRLHTAPNRFGASWGSVHVSTAVLDGGFLSPDAIQTSTVDTTLRIDAGALAAAVRRIGLYTDAGGVLELAVADGEIRLSGANQRSGEATEHVKADVSGGRTSPSFQVRYLLDALRPFTGQEVSLGIQPGMRATIVSAVDPGDVNITYYVMPMRAPGR
ncbi:DNA polymerase III subunit beta [Amycolatopsis antarctica]|uniref:DNA polymerase III subunit beta n=1 Tax=Amycolatopsis antarctica TaxID=1854586 RepID=A0A263D4J7_9PSEU|nr:DNA polymerase III subunit beta [Amycolatopsis antarctica]OZM73380.1 DNA polymerase III subunit beta [Amycolatopsis antarctica]